MRSRLTIFENNFGKIKILFCMIFAVILAHKKGGGRQPLSPENAGIGETETAIDCSLDKRERLLSRAIHLLLCSGSFELTQKHSRVGKRSLEFWISWANENGIDGPTCLPAAARPSPDIL